MMKEFYFRDDLDPNYIPDLLETSNEIEALIYQIKMTLNTSKGSVLGSTQFGASLEDLLFITNYNQNNWKAKVNEQLNAYSMLAREYKIDIDTVKYTQGYSDIGLIDIKINNKSIMGFAFDNK